MLNMSNSEQKNVNSENNTLIINNKNYEIDKIEICGKYNVELVTKNSNITLYLDLNKDVIASLVLNEKTNISDKISKDQNIKMPNLKEKKVNTFDLRLFIKDKKKKLKI